VTVRIIAVASLGLMLEAAVGTTVVAGKDRHDPISQKIEQERRTLEKLKDEIQEKKKQADAAAKQKESVLQAIQELDGRQVSSRQERQSIDLKLKQKDRELEHINAQLAAVRARLSERRESIQARLRAQYIEGRFGYLKALLGAGTYADFQRRFEYLSAVSNREYDLIEAHRADVERLIAAERHRAAARGDMLALKEQTEKKLAEIQGLKRQKHVVLTRILEEKGAYDRAVGELERSAARVDGLLKDLEQRRRAAAHRPRKGTLGSFLPQGSLQWPADGDVVSFFGRQKHPSFETYIERKGIEIRTDEGSPIRAVMAGSVEYADWLKGYGLVLILDHTNGLFSLYAHASKLLCKVGEHVRAGQVIGETGDTGMTGESTLYFELREGAEPVDPLAWLAKR